MLLTHKKLVNVMQVNDFMKGGGTDAPEEEEEEEEEPRPSVSYDDMWAKTLLDGSDSSVILSRQKSPDMV